jgi:hypothetical protein
VQNEARLQIRYMQHHRFDILLRCPSACESITSRMAWFDERTHSGWMALRFSRNTCSQDLIFTEYYKGYNCSSGQRAIGAHNFCPPLDYHFICFSWILWWHWSTMIYATCEWPMSWIFNDKRVITVFDQSDWL